MNEHAIEYAWLLTWNIGPGEADAEHHGALNPALYPGVGNHPGIPLSELVAARDRYPTRFVLGFCPHPEWRHADKMLESAHAMHGVRVCGEWKYRYLLDDPRCLEIFHAAGRLRMPVVLHLDVPYLLDDAGVRRYQPRWYGGTVDNLEGALRACPDTVFIGHAPGFWREISGEAYRDPDEYPSGPVRPGGRVSQLLDSHPNLYADLSAGSALTALSRDPAHATGFLIRYAGRLLFGRDYYGQELHSFISTLDLEDKVREQIYWRNAECLVAAPTFS